MGSSSLSSVPSTTAVSALFAGAAVVDEVAVAAEAEVAVRLRRAAIEASDHASSSGSLSEEAISMGNVLEPPSVEERVVRSTVLDGTPDWPD